MLLLWAVPIGLLIGYLRGGRLASLGQIQFRATWLVFLALVLQVLIFPLPGLDGPILASGTSTIHLASYAVLVLFALANWREWGIVVMGGGMALNAIVIALNGGFMPTTPAKLRQAGLESSAKALEACVTVHQGRCTHANSVRMDGETTLGWLGDVFATPEWIPLANVFSVGDAVLMIGLVAYLQAKMVAGKRPSVEP
ncbi:MAG: DUF5317 domain-containing protein [Candidatus Bipolaricaulia bacterium]